jgi:signal transduction histidine kinase
MSRREFIGALSGAESPLGLDRRLRFLVGERAWRWGRNVGIAIAFGLLYFLVTRLSQGLWRDPHGEAAFFWPPTGFAAAVMIALGPRVRWPLVSAIVVLNILAELTTQIADVTLGQTFMFAIGNVAEPLIIAKLVEHYFGKNFSLNRARDLFGLFGAACVGIIITVTWYASALKMVLDPSISFLTTWLDFFLGHSVGFLTIGPFVIGFFAAIRIPPSWSEFFEGAVALVLLGLTVRIIASLPPEHWDTVTPVALLFPVLLWLAVRCRPVFAAAGVFILSYSIVWLNILGIGHFGDARLSVSDRILQIQAIILVAAASGLILATLFAERKEIAERLVRSNMMLNRERENRLMNVNAATSSIAHEVRQPLTAITAAASAARRWLERVPPDVRRVKQLLDYIERAGFRANEVLVNLRRLFQDADHGQQPIDVNNMTLEALQTLNGELNDHSVKTHVELASELPLVMGHRVQLQEVISNLVYNAIDAMAPIKLDRRTLKVRTKADGAKAVIVEVEDSGYGIEPERLGSIFEPFVTTKPHGTGLGLAICSTIVERHGGRLIASSEGKNGALFQIVLPVGRPVTDIGRLE